MYRNKSLQRRNVVSSVVNVLHYIYIICDILTLLSNEVKEVEFGITFYSWEDITENKI